MEDSSLALNDEQERLVSQILELIESQECRMLKITNLAPLIAKVIDDNDVLEVLNKHNPVFGKVCELHSDSQKVFYYLDRVDSFSLSILFNLYK
jgi:hypothetical protein